MTTACTARLSMLGAVAAMLFLGACASHDPYRPIETTSADRWRPVVTEEVARIDLGPGLSPADRGAVAAFLREYREVGHGPLVIGAPPGADAASMEREIRRIAADAGVALGDVAVGVSAGGPPGSPYNVSFIRYRAHAPQCGLEWPSLSQTARSETYANFGCAHNANLAAIIADPADLLWPRETDPADAARRGAVLQNYRAGQPTGAARGDGESVSVSGQ